MSVHQDTKDEINSNPEVSFFPDTEQGEVEKDDNVNIKQVLSPNDITTPHMSVGDILRGRVELALTPFERKAALVNA